MLGWLAMGGIAAAGHMAGYAMSAGYRGLLESGVQAIKGGMGGKGFTALKSNVGFGFKALKANPGRIMGRGIMKDMYGAGRNMPFGPAQRETLGRHARNWWAAGDLAGLPNLQRTARWARRGAAIGGIPAAGGAADFLNPWGLGWGD